MKLLLFPITWILFTACGANEINHEQQFISHPSVKINEKETTIGEGEGLNVVNGQSVNLSDFPAVVALGHRWQDGANSAVSWTAFGCTGTFIDHRTIITAAHCTPAENDDFDADGNLETFTNHIYQDNSSNFVDVSGQAINPNTDFEVNGDDLAIYTFNSDQPISTFPLCDNEAEDGDLFTIVGFGCNDYAATDNTDGTTNCTGGGWTEKRFGANTIISVGDLITFHGVSNDDTSDGTNATSGSGDSGGPLIVNQNGVDCIAGITSGGNVSDSDADGNNDSKSSSYVNIHSQSSRNFLISQIENIDCDVFELNCANRAAELFEEVWGPLKDETWALRSTTINNITNELQSDLKTVSDAKKEEMKRYSEVVGLEIVAKILIPSWTIIY